MKLIYVNTNKLSENKQLALSWFNELEPFVQMILIQAFGLKEINHKTVEVIYNQRAEFLKQFQN